MRKIFASPAVIVPMAFMAACSGGNDDVSPTSTDPGPGSGSDPAQTRPAGEMPRIVKEGRIEQGAECLLLVTPDGERWAFNQPEADFGVGNYVEIIGEPADASFCMEGEGTIIPQSIAALQPPARDRDPARAGGIALTPEYVTGSWTAPGIDADCERPNFQISQSPGAVVIETSVNGTPETGRVVLGDYPRIDWDDPLPDMPLESRGPDGLAVLRPATDAEYDPVEVGGNLIVGDGVEFIKCG